MALDRVEHVADDERETTPGGGVSVGLLAARPRQLVVLRAAVVVGRGPARADPTAPLEPMERRIERALAHVERVARDLLEALRDRPAVLGLERQGLEDQQ